MEHLLKLNLCDAHILQVEPEIMNMNSYYIINTSIIIIMQSRDKRIPNVLNEIKKMGTNTCNVWNSTRVEYDFKLINSVLPVQVNRWHFLHLTL